MASRLLPRAACIQSLWQSSYTYPVRPEFLTSAAAKFVNPRGHIMNTDNVTQTLPASAVIGMSDERVLALFTSGFFGGFIFAFERVIAYYLPAARYTGFAIPQDAVTIWKNSDVSETSLLPVGSSLFGIFCILDRHIAAVPSVEEPSYVDYGFGSDESFFSGCHRFQITHLPIAENEEPQVQIELHHLRCNPQENKPSAAEIIERFHFAYAKMLFANGVQAVLSR